MHKTKKKLVFLISSFRRILYVVCFLFSNSPASGIYMPTFRSTMSVPSSYLPMKMEQRECSETLAYKFQTPGNYPEESIQQRNWYFPRVNSLLNPLNLKTHTQKIHLYGWLGDSELMGDYSAKLTFLYSIKHFLPHFTVSYILILLTVCSV
jgi:hypothetical protein